MRYILIETDRIYRFNSIVLAERKAALRRAATYMYLFEWDTPPDPKMLAHHALEITFAFDNTTRVPGPSGGGAKPAALADKISDAWITFARAGNPNTSKLPQWPAVRRATPRNDGFQRRMRRSERPRRR